MLVNAREQRIKGLTNITVYRSPIDYVVVPYNRIDKLHQASQTRPEHIQASPRIPGCAAQS